MKQTRRLLLPYLYPAHSGILVALWLTGLLGAGLSLVGPRVIGKLTNLFTHGSMPTMRQVTWDIALLFLSQIAFAFVCYWRKSVELRLQETVCRTLMLDLYWRVVRFSAEFFRDREVEKINARVLDDANTAGKIMVSAAVLAPTAALSMIIFAGVMLAQNLFLGMCMIPLALLSRYYVLFDRKVQALSRRNRQVWDDIVTQGAEAITLAPEFRGHYAFDYGLKGLRNSFSRFQRVLFDTAKLQALFQAISPLVAVIQTGALYWLGAALCAGYMSFASHGMNWGKVIEFMLIVQLFQAPSKDLGIFMGDWQLTRENRRRVGEYLEQAPVFTRNGAGPQLPAASDIVYDSVSVQSATGASIINRMNLSIQPGEHIAFCGPAGCGKTTAMQLIVRGAQPADGHLKLASRSVEEYDIVSFAQHVALVSQKPLLMDTTIRNNVLLGLRREGSLQDDEGPLDIARLSQVTDVQSLNAELCRVIRAVGLEADVLRKCLDNPAPACAQSAGFRNRIAELRAAVAEAGRNSETRDVVRFDFSTAFPGSVGDNLFGPGAVGRDTDSAAAKLTAAVKDADFLAELARIGRRRMRTERLLDAKAATQSTATDPLADVRAAEMSSGISASAKTANDGSISLSRMFISAALAADIEIAISYARDHGGETGAEDFSRRLIDARRTIASADPQTKSRWDRLPSGAYIQELSVRENLLGGRVDGHIHGASERVDAHIQSAIEHLNLLPAAVLMGLESRVGEGGRYLSGGQRQKIAIARAVMKNPGILLLDEATASLDETSQAKIIQLLRDGFQNKTVISISHRLTTIRDFNRVIVLDRGEVVQAGSYDALTATEGIFRDLVNQEQGKATAPPAAKSDTTTAAGAPAFADLQRRLALSDVFASMGSEQLAYLASAAKVVDCRPGEVLFHRGDTGSELYLVLDGQVSFFKDSDPGKEPTIVGQSGPGKVFGELALFGYGTRTLSARTGPATRLLVLGQEDLLRLIAADHRIAIGLLRAAAKRLIDAEERIFAGSMMASAR